MKQIDKRSIFTLKILCNRLKDVKKLKEDLLNQRNKQEKSMKYEIDAIYKEIEMIKVEVNKEEEHSTLCK